MRTCPGGRPPPPPQRRCADHPDYRLAVLDERLRGKDFLVGKALTIADLSIASSLMYAKQTDAPLGSFSSVQSWFSRISDLDAWKNTDPQ